MPFSIRIKFFIILALFSVGVCSSLIYGGSENLKLSDVSSDFIFYQIRLPKTITAIFAGSCLAVSGLILQVVFRNPLAGPYVLGISSGASLMVAITILVSGSFNFLSTFFFGKGLIIVSSMLGSFLVTILILFISNRIRSNIILLLIGLMFSQICGAIETVLEYFSDPNSLKSFVVWGMGTLSNTVLSDLPGFVIISITCLSSLLFFIKPLNAFLLGEQYAQNLGIQIKKSRFGLIFISSALTGVITAYCGPIAFIGIAVPILARMIFKTAKQHVQYLACMIIGASLLLFSDGLCHSLSNQFVLPINLLTTCIGAPLVIYLMFKNKQW